MLRHRWLRFGCAVAIGLCAGSGRAAAQEGFSYVGVPVGTYTFTVRAVNGQGSSAASNPVTLTFPGICAAPETPAQFSVTNSGRFATVAWAPSANGAAPTGYTLLVTGSFAGAIPLHARSISATIAPGTYTLSVVATNLCGASSPTATKTLVIH